MILGLSLINRGNRWSQARFQLNFEDLIWSLLLSGFFLFFFIWPSLGSALAKLALVLAVARILIWPMALGRQERLWILFICIPLWIYLLSGLLHDWSPRHLDRPFHLVYAALLFLALRGRQLHWGMIVGSQVFSLLAALPIALHERIFLGMDRIFGPLSGGDFGNFASPLAVACALLAIVAKSRLHFFVLVAACASGLLIAIWSGSRTAWLEAVIVFVFLAYSMRNGLRVSLLWWASGGLFVLGAAYLNQALIIQRLDLLVREGIAFFSANQAAYQSTSMGVRLESIQLGLRVCAEHPLMGIGIPGFKALAASLVDSGSLSPEIARFFGLLHNQFLDACVMAGLPALIALLVFWWYVARMCGLALSRLGPDAFNHVECSFAVLASATLLGYFVSATGGSMFGSAHGTVYLCLTLALLGAFLWKKNDSSH